MVRNTTILSIGIVAEDGEIFYRETSDYTSALVDDWINENVMKHLNWVKDGNRWSETVTHVQLREELEQWFATIAGDEQIEVWLDTGAYDWMLFCDLWGGAMGVPPVVHYIPRDLSTYFEIMGVDPDVSRMQFAEMELPPDGSMGQHHALWDALVLKGCYEKLESAKEATMDEGPATMDAMMELGAMLVEMGVLSPETYQQMHAEYRPVETPPEADTPETANEGTDSPEETNQGDSDMDLPEDEAYKLPLEDQDDAQKV